MSGALPAWPLLSAFLVASFVLAVTPGPGVLFIVTRSIVQGRRAGLASVAGVALGNLGNALGASLGLAALFAVSSIAFLVVKYVGAAYLVYLGVRMFRARSPADAAVVTPAVASNAKAFRDGFVVALLNPKTAVFFAAFLPQFLHAHADPLQSVVLGAIFVAIAAITDSTYALAAGTVAPLLTGRTGAGRYGRRIGGGIFIGLGLFTALSGGRAPQS